VIDEGLELLGFRFSNRFIFLFYGVELVSREGSVALRRMFSFFFFFSFFKANPVGFHKSVS